MTETTSYNLKWNPFEKIGFRFSFIYLLLFIIFQNNGAYPLWDFLMQKPTEWLQNLIPWIAKHILHLSYDITVFTNGSGDTTYDYIIVLLILVTSFLVTIIWSLIDRHRDNYSVLYYWLSVAVRFYVGLMLINYGLYKIIKLQFPSPSFSRLLQSYGESSPMGLAWTFLGFSKGYNLFMGVAEVLAGMLLFRRTVTAGAIITLMTTANVMAVNFFYDVPVKILSTHLVLMTIFLLSKDLKTLFIFFFTKKSVSLQPIIQPDFKNKWMKIALTSIKILVIAYVFGYGIYELTVYQKEYGEDAPKPAVYGLYEVFYFEKNGIPISMKSDDNDRWHYIISEYEGSVQIIKTNKSSEYFESQIDTLKHEIILTNNQYPKKSVIINYKISKDTFDFETVIQNDTIIGNCKILTKESFLMNNRGFNWISEYPFNR